MAKLTFGDLMTAAGSNDPDQRKRAYALFEAWIKAAPRLAPDDRLSQTQRAVLMQLFAQKGFKPSTVPTQRR